MTLQEIQKALSNPFDPRHVRFRAGATNKDKTKAMALGYIDARAVMSRLDAVVGIGGWKDHYTIQPGGSVVCRLSVYIGDQWVTKCDVGSESEQPDEGDKLKAAFSDALKRAAVKFGIGRYLYRLPSQWVAYDAQRKQLAVTPTLPDWAQPAKPAPSAAAVAKA